jgi:hypothetical protein
MRLTVITAEVDEVGTTYADAASATAAMLLALLDVLDVLDVLVLVDETVDALSLLEPPPHATTVVSSAKITAPRRTV